VSSQPITLFLCGDVMTGRGIDQALPHPGDPELYEAYVTDAREYLRLAEDANGAIGVPVAPDYVWGDALDELARLAPDLRIINLETAITAHDRPEPKGINYRMHPANIDCLKAAAPDCCVLANNHVLDWGHAGLAETLATLEQAGLGHAGAGLDLARAAAPRVLAVPGKGRVLVLALGHGSSGIPADWAAGPTRAGVNLLPDLSAATVDAIAAQLRPIKQPGDIVVASIHWGGNWGYGVPAAQRDFAHALIDRAGVDLLHGHSSHHAKGIEVYRGHLILYGCGDLLTDYEGIQGYEDYRDDLGLLYFPRLDPASGRLLGLTMTPTRLRRLRINRTAADETAWLADMLNREGRAFGTAVSLDGDGRLQLHWQDQEGCRA
jgi:poly-gamma-glutamate synthesis protein (capsule biosynthesis protein)